MDTIEDSAPTRDSHTIKAEITGLRRLVSEAAESHDNRAYNQAVSTLNARRQELEAVGAREITEARNAALAKRRAEQFKAEYGFDSPGELIANRLTTDQQQRHQAIAAQRAAQLAETILAVPPTPADQAAAALARFRQQAQDLGGVA